MHKSQHKPSVYIRMFSNPSGWNRGGLGCLEGEIVSLHHLYKVQLCNFTVVICGKSL